MWRKKTKSTPQERRSVGSNQQAPRSFSYYSSGPTQTRTAQSSDRGAPPQRKFNVTTLKPHTTRVVALCLIVLTVLGVTTLSSRAHLTFVGHADGLAQSDKLAYQEDVNRAIGGNFWNRFKLTVNPAGVAKQLREQHPEFQNISVVVPVITRQLNITVRLTEPVARFENSGKTYGIDSNGYLITAPPSSIKIPLIVDQSGITPDVGTQILPSSTMQAVRVVSTQLSGANISINRIVLQKNTPYELTVFPEGKGYSVKFNLKADILQQSGAYVATNKHLGQTKPKEYVDVRVPGRIYYK